MTTRGASDFVGKRVQAARTAREWTAKELAAHCTAVGAPEITTAVIANIESGRRDKDGRRRRDVTVDELLALAYAFEVSPAELLRTGEWTAERLAITSADGEVAATDVAAWVAGHAPAPLRSLLGGGLARCASCGSELWLKYLHAEGRTVADDDYYYYQCINEECPAPAVRRSAFLDLYIVSLLLLMLSKMADEGDSGWRPPDEQEWETLSLSDRRRLLRALLTRVLAGPVPQPEQAQTFDRSSVQFEWVWESPEDDHSEAGT